MKRSVFTSVFDGDEGRAIAFNAMNGALALIDEQAKRALVDGDVGETCTGILEELDRAGFLAPSSLDEENALAERFLTDMNETGFLSLCIAPTLECNLRCIYCYEKHEHVRMGAQVEDAIMRFIGRRYDRYRFADLDVLWYGGEPMLEFPLIKRLSERMLAWCGAHGIAYRARIITNATLIDDAAAAELSSIGVIEAMPTLDGSACTHDARRVHADGAGSFEATMAGIRALARAGVRVGANCNLDWENEAGYRQVRDDLRGEGCAIYASHLRNYGGWCRSCEEGSDRPREKRACSAHTKADPAAFDLMSRGAYARELFALYAEENPSAESLRQTLFPRRSFCRGKMASYFVIDPEGNAYRCDGFMRDPGHVLFNVLDADCEISWPETRTLYERNARCRGCAVMPLCLGDCDWEWSMFGDNCSALKTTLGDYVRLLVGKLAPAHGESAFPQGHHVWQLVTPRTTTALYARAFSPFAGEGIM